MPRKLTLSMDEKDIRAACRIAREHGTSISGMFTRLVRVMVAKRRRPMTPRDNNNQLPPLTHKAYGMVNIPEGKTDRELLEEALLEKYGLDE